MKDNLSPTETRIIQYGKIVLGIIAITAFLLK